ncbi:MAG: gamma-glutamyltransferase, partial [Actinocatenispora sp.]
PGPGLPDDAKVAVHTAGGPGHPAGQRDSVAELGELTGSVPLPPTTAEPRRPPHRDNLQLAVGAAGASRIRTALVHTMTAVLVDGLDPETAIARARFHVVDGTAHAEPGVPEDELAALSRAGYRVHQWPEFDHYFGGVSAVGRTGAGGDPRRGGIGMHL